MATLAVFAKYPQVGQVKTRLAATLGPERAAYLAERFLYTTLRRLDGLAADSHLVFAPAALRTAMEAWLQRESLDRRWQLVPQRSGDLGARLSHYFESTTRTGHQEPVVVVGADTPHLPRRYIVEAIDQLGSAGPDDPVVVLGPSEDGGYYLVAARQPPPIFRNVAWGSSRVWDQTMAHLERRGWRVVALPPWYDIDTMDEVRRLLDRRSDPAMDGTAMDGTRATDAALQTLRQEVAEVCRP